MASKILSSARVEILLRHLGLERVHVAACMSGDWGDLVTKSGDRLCSLTVVAPFKQRGSRSLAYFHDFLVRVEPLAVGRNSSRKSAFTPPNGLLPENRPRRRAGLKRQLTDDEKDTKYEPFNAQAGFSMSTTAATAP